MFRSDPATGLPLSLDWKWSQDKTSSSPPRNLKLGTRSPRSPISAGGSGSAAAMRMYSSSYLGLAADKDASTSPSSFPFLNPAMYSLRPESRASSSESLPTNDCRWDAKFKIKTAPFGGKPTEMKEMTDETDDDAQERTRQAMSSGSSNASSDSVTSTGMRSGSLTSSTWVDFTSSMWDEELTSDHPIFEDCAPYAEELELLVQAYCGCLRASKWLGKDASEVIKHAKETLARFSTSRTQLIHRLADNMNVKRLLTPCIEVQLPTEAILLLNSGRSVLPCDLDDVVSFARDELSLLAVYSQNPIFSTELSRLRHFFDRFDTNKEVMAYFVWSSADSELICLPCTKVTPYPLCRTCALNFGTRSCSQCQIARYCSRECQVEDWDEHQHSCPSMRDSLAGAVDLFPLFEVLPTS